MCTLLNFKTHNLHMYKVIIINIIIKIINSILPSTPRFLFPLGFPTKITYEYLFSPMNAECPENLISLICITLII
jgi:hypothetical protein